MKGERLRDFKSPDCYTGCMGTDSALPVGGKYSEDRGGEKGVGY